MVDFAGWHMPLHYGSQLEEHHAVRTRAGAFDVSHMLPVDFSGKDCTQFLQLLVASDVTRLDVDGRAMYTVMLNDEGGILDDLIVYRTGSRNYRAIFNAGSANSDVAWVKSKLRSSFEVKVSPRNDLNIVAVQGPEAVQITTRVIGVRNIPDLRPFTCDEFEGYFIGRTGYTGEDGVEILCSSSRVQALWSSLLECGVAPCGLGARDTLRLEAGLNLNGQDMSPEISPLESALAWVVHWDPEDREFIGRRALDEQREAGPTRKLTGIVLQDGIMRPGQPVHTSDGVGEVTSGSYSPTLGYSIALARVPREASGDCKVTIRKSEKTGRLVRPPFVRKGRKVHK